jgi:hypothetical protein
MKLSAFLFLLFIPFSIQLNAHEYYFSFAEMQYNTKTSQIEISLEVSGHDFEDYLKERGVLIPRLEECVGQSMYMTLIQKELSKGFEIMVKGKPLSLDLIGMRINDNDQIVFFLTSREIQKPEQVEVRYDLLMNFFPLQQNKITVFKASGKEFVTFLNTRSKRTIEL